MYNYIELTTDLIENKVIDKNSVYDYSPNQLSDFYEQFYQFCQENLSTQWEKEQIDPARIFFNFENSFNAFASKRPPYNLIGINYILPYSLVGDFNNFNEKVKAFFSAESISEVFSEENFSPSLLITQFSLLYIYYHELGHILQNNTTDFLTTENYNEEDFDFEKHLKEFDADIFSAEKLAMHINEYWLKNCPNNDINSLEVLLSIGISGIFNFIIHTFNMSAEFYTKSKSHPHPVIRISYIIEFILMAIEQIHNDKKINSIKIVRDAFEIAILQVTNTKFIDLFIKTFKDEHAQIKHYTNELMEALKLSETLSMSSKVN